MTKRTRSWLVAAVAGAMLMGLPGIAAATEGTATATTAAVTEDKAPNIDQIKRRAVNAIERRLVTVARLSHRVEKSKTVTDEHAANLLADLRDAAAGLKELGRAIKAAETVEELRKLVPLIAQDFRIYEVVKPKVLEVLASDRLVVAAKRLSEFGNKLETLIGRADDAGYDVTKAKLVLARMRANVRVAVELGGPVADMVIDLQPADWPDPARELLANGHRRLGATSDHLRQATHQGRKIVRWLRNLADPSIDLGLLD